MSEEKKGLVQGEKSKTNKTLGRKIRESFIYDDLSSVKDHIVDNIIIPEIKSGASNLIWNALTMLRDVFSGATDNVLYKGQPPVHRTDIRGKQNYASFYNSTVPFNSQNSGGSKTIVTTNGTTTVKEKGPDYQDISYKSIGDAWVVLEAVQDIIKQCGRASVGDLYDISQMSCEYTYYDWGWTNLNNAEPYRGGDGCYYLRLPRPIKFNK